jgi:hypothetical protein
MSIEDKKVYEHRTFSWLEDKDLDYWSEQGWELVSTYCQTGCITYVLRREKELTKPKR